MSSCGASGSRSMLLLLRGEHGDVLQERDLDLWKIFSVMSGSCGSKSCA